MTNPNSKQTVGVLNIISPTGIKEVNTGWFYLSADKVNRDIDDGHQNVFDIDRAVYSEINDSEKNIDIRNMAFEYDYAQAWQEQ